MNDSCGGITLGALVKSITVRRGAVTLGCRTVSYSIFSILQGLAAGTVSDEYYRHPYSAILSRLGYSYSYNILCHIIEL